MYIICPSCDATYEISERHFTDGTRQVRCTACDYQWMASVDTSGTINDLMGESAEEAFDGLRGFLETGNDKEGGKEVPKSGNGNDKVKDGGKEDGGGVKLGVRLSQKAKEVERREAVLRMLGGDPGSQSSDGWFWVAFLLLFVPLIAIAVLFFGQNEIIERFPEAAAVYEFMRSVGTMIYTTAEDLLQI